MLDRRQFLSLPPASALAQTLRPSAITRVDVIHHSHLDVGFTDSPSVCRDMQKRFLDAALDTCLANRQFHWTIEALLVLDDWWRTSPASRRDRLLSAIRDGQMDAMALPLNQTPFQNAAEWDQMLSWIPDSLWREVQPRAAMQSDVNGFPRAGAMRLLDHSVNRLLMGINADSGGPPLRRPSAFWWRMPDGRKMFVWLGDHYGTAYSYFEPQNWLRGGRGADTTLGPPRPGDFLRTNEASVRACHKHMTGRLAKLQAEGYSYATLLISFTNQWRYDNDPPFPPLADFITAWNRLGLQPELRFTTATEALASMEREIGGIIPTFEGEWTDWWANGDASGPRALAASRVAKRYLAAAMAPVWGPIPASAQRDVERILRDLCLFDEHTWGADSSISHPEGLETIGQYTEKSLLAYRPRASAQWLLSRRARTKIVPIPEGLYVANTAPEPYSGWVRLPKRAVRGEFTAVQTAPGSKVKLNTWERDDFVFWAEHIPASSISNWKLMNGDSDEPQSGPVPSFHLDANKWPVSAVWPGCSKSLFTAELGDFISVGVIPPANRSTIARMHATADPAKREEMGKAAFRTERATYGQGEIEQTPHTLIFTQPFTHSRLEYATRRVELWKRLPRASVTVRFRRTSSVSPEVFYIAFGFPVEGQLPAFSCGGVPFVPYKDQLDGSCRDYYAIDGWAHYATASGDWLWVTRDAALIAVGGPHTVEHRTKEPADSHRLLAMVFDNFWHTNFVADSHGEMSFQFELLWRDRIAHPEQAAETLASDPVVVMNEANRESPELLNNLFRP